MSLATSLRENAKASLRFARDELRQVEDVGRVGQDLVVSDVAVALTSDVDHASVVVVVGKKHP